VKTGRFMLGATDPKDSNPGTIRGDLCIQVGRWAIHSTCSCQIPPNNNNLINLLFISVLSQQTDAQ